MNLEEAKVSEKTDFSGMVMNSPAPASSVFQIGNHKTKLMKVEAASQKCCSRTTTDPALPPPRPLLICTPSSETGEFNSSYPVVLLLHGYLLNNSFYSQLIQHIASHGFIVVAPQLYSVAGPDTNEEIKATAEITSWLSEGLVRFLPLDVKPNLKKLVLAGHSRGGKVAFALALNKSPIASPKFSALIGIDPVDGMDKGKQTPPPVLTYTPHSFDLDGTPVLVIGSGLGEVKKNALFPPCAPKGVNHEDFYNECCKPAYYFVAKDYGHLDVLDDDTKGVRGKATHCLCKNGESREPMRKFVGGVAVAFMKAYLDGDSSDLLAIRDGTDLMELPVELQRVEFEI